MKKIKIITVLCFLALAGTVKTQDVSNIRLQLNDELLVVTYDLAAIAEIEAYISLDSGVTWLGPLKHVTGAIGKSVTPEKDKIFVWNAQQEVGYVDVYAQLKIVSTVTFSDTYSTERNLAFTVKNVTFEMVYVEGGTFTMGCNSEEDSDCENDEKPLHEVTLPDFYIGKLEVNQSLWNAIMSQNPSDFKGDDLPVENVTWDDCLAFIKRLNKITKKNFRLPTEAEWEYAAHGGTRSKSYMYSGSNDLDEVAWHWNRRTHEVGSKEPNELGIYDMTGNVWEWCSDWYDKNYYSNSPLESPKGISNGLYRVFRGGGWNAEDPYCRIVNRNGRNPDVSSNYVGFRIVLQ